MDERAILHPDISGFTGLRARRTIDHSRPHHYREDGRGAGRDFCFLLYVSSRPVPYSECCVVFLTN